MIASQGTANPGPCVIGIMAILSSIHLTGGQGSTCIDVHTYVDHHDAKWGFCKINGVYARSPEKISELGSFCHCHLCYT